MAPISVVMPMRSRSLISLLCLGLGLTLSPAVGAPSTISRAVGKCDVFPSDNPWNQRVDDLPVLGNSAAMIRQIGRNTGLHPDFGSGKYDGARIGIPYVTVPKSQKKVRVRYNEYGDESDPGPFPIPRDAPIEGGRRSDGDRHVIVVQRGTCKLIELYHARPAARGGRWTAGSGATWDLDSNKLRP